MCLCVCVSGSVGGARPRLTQPLWLSPVHTRTPLALWRGGSSCLLHPLSASGPGLAKCRLTRTFAPCARERSPATPGPSLGTALSSHSSWNLGALHVSLGPHVTWVPLLSPLPELPHVSPLPWKPYPTAGLDALPVSPAVLRASLTCPRSLAASDPMRCPSWLAMWPSPPRGGRGRGRQAVQPGCVLSGGRGGTR